MNEILINIIIGIVVGLVTGLVTSTIVNSRGFLDSASRARCRVRKTVEATKEIFDTSKNRGRTRDRHRYSLAVIIDNLEQTWRSNFREDLWPSLVNLGRQNDGQQSLVNQQQNPDPNADRWDLFNQHIRPVSEQIEPFSNLSKYPFWLLWTSTLFPPIRESRQQIRKEILQLEALIKLCKQLESVVAELDAAFEKKNLVEPIELNDGHYAIKPTDDALNSESKIIEQLRNKYHNLYTAWLNWLSIVDVN